MQHTLLITYLLTKEVMKSALLLLFFPPIMSWNNSFQLHAIRKDRAVCIQVTSAGTQSLLQMCAQGHISPELERAREGANPPEAVTHLTLWKPIHLSVTFSRETWWGCPGTGLLCGYTELCNKTRPQNQRGDEAEQQQGEEIHVHVIKS